MIHNGTYARAVLRKETPILRPVVHRVECQVDGCCSGAFVTLPTGDDPADLEYTCAYHNGFIYGGGNGRLIKKEI